MLTADHIDDSIARALRGESHLDPAVLDILGFATPTMRHMFNNLCNVEDGVPFYLECGVYAGASFCSACSNNQIYAIGIDNFGQSWHDGRQIRSEFMANKAAFCDSGASPVFIEADCFKPDLLIGVEGIDIFYFDGGHTQEEQARALPHFFDLLADTFLFIVDDYNWPDVKNGTSDGFFSVDNKMSVIHSRILTGEVGQDDKIFHNGIALFLCTKSAS